MNVGLGSDKTVADLKKRRTINSEDERLYMLEALSCVHNVKVNRGSGILDFLDDMKVLNPDIFIVNEDGHTPDKEQICKDLCIDSAKNPLCQFAGTIHHLIKKRDSHTI